LEREQTIYSRQRLDVSRLRGETMAEERDRGRNGIGRWVLDGDGYQLMSEKVLFS
jgi:hypothetical protein